MTFYPRNLRENKMQTNKSPLSRTPGDQPPHLHVGPVCFFSKNGFRAKKEQNSPWGDLFPAAPLMLPFLNPAGKKRGE